MKEVRVGWDFTICSGCGVTGDFTVITKSEKDNYFFDGENVICNVCGNIGVIDIVDAEGLDVYWEE